MSQTASDGFTELVEECADCERETRHNVHVEVRTENPDSDHASSSNQPYRIAECLECGHSSEIRINSTQADTGGDAR